MSGAYRSGNSESIPPPAAIRRLPDATTGSHGYTQAPAPEVPWSTDAKMRSTRKKRTSSQREPARSNPRRTDMLCAV